jgi:DNA processing protein
MSSPYYQQDDDLFLAALAAIPGLGPKRLQGLFDQQGSWQKAWEADMGDWEKINLPAASRHYWQKQKNNFKSEVLDNYLNRTKTNLITKTHPFYPTRFHDLPDPPILIYSRGKWPRNNKIITAVGSRRPTPYGEAVAAHLIPPLAESGYSIASGLALGLDTLVHKLSLENKGHTIAILGSGLDNIYPASNRNLVEKIMAAGSLLISEYHPESAPLRSNFIQRNRLLAAIGEKTLILEAGLNSGSILTARLAKKMGRSLYAVPGNILSEEAAGCHHLLQEGAIITTKTSDILSIKEEKYSRKTNKKIIDPEEREILKILKINFSQFRGTSADEIGQELKLDTSSVNSKLSMMEIKKLVRLHQGRYYLLTENGSATTLN